MVHSAEPKAKAVLEMDTVDVAMAEMEPFGAAEAKETGHVPDATVAGRVVPRHVPNGAVAVPSGVGVIVARVGAAAVATCFSGGAAGSASSGVAVGAATGEASPLTFRPVPEMSAPATGRTVARPQEVPRPEPAMVAPRMEPIGPRALLGPTVGPTSVQLPRTFPVAVRATVEAARRPMARPLARVVRATATEVAGRVDTSSPFPEAKVGRTPNPAAALTNSVLHTIFYS